MPNKSWLRRSTSYREALRFALSRGLRLPKFARRYNLSGAESRWRNRPPALFAMGRTGVCQPSRYGSSVLQRLWWPWMRTLKSFATGFFVSSVSSSFEIDDRFHDLFFTHWHSLRHRQRTDDRLNNNWPRFFHSARVTRGHGWQGSAANETTQSFQPARPDHGVQPLRW